MPAIKTLYMDLRYSSEIIIHATCFFYSSFILFQRSCRTTYRLLIYLKELQLYDPR